MEYPCEVLNRLDYLVIDLVITAHSSEHFNSEKINSLLESNDQYGVISTLLKWARHINDLYLFPCDNEYNLLPLIRFQIDKLTNIQVNK